MLNICKSKYAHNLKSIISLLIKIRSNISTKFLRVDIIISQQYFGHFFQPTRRSAVRNGTQRALKSYLKSFFFSAYKNAFWLEKKKSICACKIVLFFDVQLKTCGWKSAFYTRTHTNRMNMKLLQYVLAVLIRDMKWITRLWNGYLNSRVVCVCVWVW